MKNEKEMIDKCDWRGKVKQSWTRILSLSTQLRS